MQCNLCGRRLKSSDSIEIGYGPVCYQKVFGSSKRIKRGEALQSADEIPYYDIRGRCLWKIFSHPMRSKGKKESAFATLLRTDIL